jgi:hypothetical protein
MRLTQFLLENMFGAGVLPNQPTKIPTIYKNTKYNNQINTDEKVIPMAQDGSVDDFEVNQFNDTQSFDQQEEDNDVTRELDDILGRLRNLILNKNNDCEQDEEMQRPPIEGDDDFEQEDPGQEDFPSNNETSDEDIQEDDAVKRHVKGAHLVFKRKTPDGLYEELWLYNVGKNTKSDEYAIRREILRGTDIESRDNESEDGTQSYSIWTAGNAQMLHIVGLPN